MCECCDCSAELGTMRVRMGALSRERADLYHELATLQARLATMRSTTRITEEKTRTLPLDLATSTRAGAYLILRNQLKGPDMSKPLIYTVIERQATDTIHPGERPVHSVKVKLVCEEVAGQTIAHRGGAAVHLHAGVELNFHNDRDAEPYLPGRRFALVPVVDAPPVGAQLGSGQSPSGVNWPPQQNPAVPPAAPPAAPVAPPAAPVAPPAAPVVPPAAPEAPPAAPVAPPAAPVAPPASGKPAAASSKGPDVKKT